MRTYLHKEKIKSRAGYVLIYAPGHPRSHKNRVFEHILVWETANNMSVPDGYVVHHINGIKHDNRIENLLLMSKVEHIKLHHTGQRRTDKTKNKIRQKAIARLKNQRNNPMYKDVPIEELFTMVENGETVKSVCQKFNICRATYYKKLKERGTK